MPLHVLVEEHIDSTTRCLADDARVISDIA
jgi:hypothetical protein